MTLNHAPLQQEVLDAIWRTSGKASAVDIAAEVEIRAGKEIHIGAIYSALSRLEGKGFLKSSWSEPKPERGGRRRRLFEVTGLGQASRLSSAVHSIEEAPGV